MATFGRQPLSLRAVSLASAASLGVLILLLAAGLAWTSRLVWNSTRVSERDTGAIVLTGEIDRVLREQQRLGNLYVLSREPGLDAVRSDLQADLRNMLVGMEQYVAGDAEAHLLLGRLGEDVSAYFTERKRLEGLGLAFGEVVRQSLAPFERALDSSAALRRQNELKLRQTQEHATDLLRLQALLLGGTAVLLAAGLALLATGIRKLVLRPLLDLQGAMRSFRGGDTDARAQESTLIELREVSRTFNEMATAIARQRRNQLTFLAAVAHDLRNPLAALKTTIQALERKPSSATSGRLDLLDRQVDRLARMVNDLLDATRIEAGELQIEPEPLDLREMARTMVDLHAETTTTHRIELRLPASPVPVTADPLRLEQVVGNLITNAIKYSPQGGLVEVAVGVVDGAAELSVADRGVGIPADEIEDLFLPFRRHASTAAAPGVGLGLSIARRIVHAHHGRIDVDSKLDEGTTFRVRLPLTETHSQQSFGSAAPPGR
jgi:signal transduction histidine kinase